MTLIPDWRLVLRRAWSIRLILLAGLFAGAAVAVELMSPDMLGLPPEIFAALAAVVNAVALLARLLAQKEMPDGTEG